MLIPDKIIDFLKKWVIRYIKNKDLLFQKIESIKEGEDQIIVKYKEKEQKHFIIPFIEEEKFNEIKNEITSENNVSIFMFNTKKNFDFVINNWNILIKNRKLSLHFLHPFSKLEKIWSVFPHTQNFLTEGTGYKTALKTLSLNVDTATEEELKKIIES